MPIRERGGMGSVCPADARAQQGRPSKSGLKQTFGLPQRTGALSGTAVTRARRSERSLSVFPNGEQRDLTRSVLQN